jgi:DNA-binding NtrC family response regulator
VPPLRERKDDIPPLVRAFLHDLGSDLSRLPPGTLDRLLAHDWPGNVRELRNAVARAVWIDDPFPPVAESEARPTLLGDVLTRPFKEAKGMLLESFERRYVASLLARHGGNLSRAARASGIERNCLRRMAHKLEVEYVRVRPGRAANADSAAG